MTDWYLQSGGQIQGPYSQSELLHRARSGRIQPDTMIRAGDGPWHRADDFRFLAEPLGWQVAAVSCQEPIVPPPVPPPLRAARKPNGALRLTIAVIVAAGIVGAVIVAYLASRGHDEASLDEEEDASQPMAEAADPAGEADPANATTAIVASKPSKTPEASPPPRRENLDPVSLYNQTRAAVATIITENEGKEGASLGSGFFIDPKWIKSHYKDFKDDRRYLLTNYHVIKSAAVAKLQLDGRQFAYAQSVVMEDEEADLALLACSIPRPSPGPATTTGKQEQGGAPPERVVTLQIAGGPEPPTGERVYAIGSPRGLEASFSEGVISGRREIAQGVWWLQTTAPISTGSSGGPLLNSKGDVVGVMVALRLGGQTLNFAIPASRVAAFLKGTCNSRELWRGRWIAGEESEACTSAEKELKGQYRDLVGRKARIKIWKKDEDKPAFEQLLDDLVKANPSDFGKYGPSQ